VLLSLVAAAAPAADPASYAVTAQATRSGDVITVSVKIVENKIQFVPNVGNTNVTTTLSHPRIMLDAGQQAEIEVGQSSADSKDVRPTTPAGDVESGLRIEIISVKGQDHVLMVSTVLENKNIIWADASTVLISSQPAPANNPATTTKP
jgi:hypothetical protein